MSKSFDKMTRAELEETAKFLKVDVKPSEEGKDLINADFVSALTKFKESQDANKPEPKNVSKEEKIVNKIAGMNIGIAVIITDHDNTVDIEQDEQGRVFRFSWGNTKIGMKTTHIALHGREQYVERGALKALKAKTYIAHLKDANGKPMTEERPRFSIAETEGWTPEQFASHKKDQEAKRL